VTKGRNEHDGCAPPLCSAKCTIAPRGLVWISGTEKFQQAIEEFDLRFLKQALTTKN